jgi:hypothetical protein
MMLAPQKLYQKDLIPYGLSKECISKSCTIKNIITILLNKKPPSTYEVEWNASGLPSGVYLYRLQAGDFVETKKMILLR